MPRSDRHARGFTLIELLVVILLIALLIGITLPALAGARNAVRKSETRQIMQSFQNSYSLFRGDQDRNPGVFTQRELGDPDNGDAGLSAMENALLDLLGSEALIGRVSEVDAKPGDYPAFDSGNPNIVRVGVSTSDKDLQYYVNVAVLGSGDAYLQLDDRTLVPQHNNGTQDVAQFGASAGAAGGQPLANSGEENIPQMPDLVDPFGTPFLLWVQDEYAPSDLDTSSMDAALDGFILGEPSDPADSALFYANANKAFLAANSLGRQRRNMTNEPIYPIEEITSIIGFKNGEFDDEQRRSFMALIGNPSFPSPVGDRTLAGSIADMQAVPASPRGEFIIQSAGIDGVYFANTESGFRQRSGTSGQLEYWQHFSVSNSGEIDTTDMASFFDDVMLGAN